MRNRTNVEILERASCISPRGQMVKVLVPENGREGWTFGQNVIKVARWVYVWE